MKATDIPAGVQVVVTKAREVGLRLGDVGTLQHLDLDDRRRYGFHDRSTVWVIRHGGYYLMHEDDLEPATLADISADEIRDNTYAARLVELKDAAIKSE